MRSQYELEIFNTSLVFKTFFMLSFASFLCLDHKLVPIDLITTKSAHLRALLYFYSLIYLYIIMFYLETDRVLSSNVRDDNVWSFSYSIKRS